MDITYIISVIIVLMFSLGEFSSGKHDGGIAAERNKQCVRRYPDLRVTLTRRKGQADTRGTKDRCGTHAFTTRWREKIRRKVSEHSELRGPPLSHYYVVVPCLLDTLLSCQLFCLLTSCRNSNNKVKSFLHRSVYEKRVPEGNNKFIPVVPLGEGPEAYGNMAPRHAGAASLCRYSRGLISIQSL